MLLSTPPLPGQVPVSTRADERREHIIRGYCFFEPLCCGEISMLLWIPLFFFSKLSKLRKQDDQPQQRKRVFFFFFFFPPFIREEKGEGTFLLQLHSSHCAAFLTKQHFEFENFEKANFLGVCGFLIKKNE